MSRITLCVAIVCGIAACSGVGFDPELEVGPGDTVYVEEGVNGDVACNGGTLVVRPNVSINGTIESTNCILKVFASNNGDIIVDGGGLVYIESVTTINGAFEATGVRTIQIYGSSFNGGLSVADSGLVEVIDSHFNGDMTIENSLDVVVLDNDLNGDLTIDGAQTCTESNNGAGEVTAANCLSPTD